MPAYYDKDKKTWYIMFYAKDYQGENKKYKKTGFKKKKEALEYEFEFKKKLAGNSNMTFKSLYELYLEDAKSRLKESSIYGKQKVAEKHILPYFQDKIASDINPLMIRKWQNKLLKEKFKPNTLRAIENNLKSILNYGVKFHGLKENPFKLTGNVGGRKTAEMSILTLDEFNILSNHLYNKSENDMSYKIFYTIFNTLFWTGLRVGELLALTWQDIDFDKKTIRVNKTYSVISGKEVITSPKTEKSNRTITITSKLISILKDYRDVLYNPSKKDRVFKKSKPYIRAVLLENLEECELHKIRIHDFRHSHASLLINHDASILSVSKRLGHDDINMTLNTYAHLYENENDKLMTKLESL